MRTSLMNVVSDTTIHTAAATTTASGVGRAIILLICIIAAVFVIRSMRMVWGLIAEVMSMMMHVGATGVLALVLLIVIVLLMTGFV